MSEYTYPYPSRYNHPVYMVECWAFSILVRTRTDSEVDLWHVNKTDRYGNPVSKEAAIDEMSAIADGICRYNCITRNHQPRMDFDGTKTVDIEETTERNGY
mgnify:CR=1 FL=1